MNGRVRGRGRVRVRVPLRCSLIKGEPIAPTLGLEAAVTLISRVNRNST